MQFLWHLQRFDSAGKRGNLDILIAEARSFLARLVGLLLTRELFPQQGLLISPCKDIHTCFMRFRIDVVFLDKDNKVLAIAERVKPFRFILGPKGTKSVLELYSGAAANAGIRSGDMLSFVRCCE